MNTPVSAVEAPYTRTGFNWHSNVQYDFAKRLYDELVANEWAVPDEVEIDGMIYETELTNSEIEAIASIELQANNYFSLH